MENRKEVWFISPLIKIVISWETVEKLIKKLKKKSPTILKLAKIALNKAFNEPLNSGREGELDLFAMAFGTEDQKEGASAFLEKREPKYKGI